MRVAVAAVTCLLAGLGWKYSHGRPRTAVDEFWAPVLSQQGPVLLCTGSVVFAQDKFSGVVTAGKDIDYPFVSMQIVSAVAQLSSLLERSGASTELVSSASIPLTDLRDHSLILLGGYNNQWTMRLLDPLRFHFTQEPVESIVDKTQPLVHWSRDRSVPYSSADDYALVARFRDPTTGSWVVVLAGLGRNGTEAAAHFVTSPDYVQLLKNTLGKNLGQGNIEALFEGECDRRQDRSALDSGCLRLVGIEDAHVLPLQIRFPLSSLERQLPQELLGELRSFCCDDEAPSSGLQLSILHRSWNPGPHDDVVFDGLRHVLGSRAGRLASRLRNPLA